MLGTLALERWREEGRELKLVLDPIANLRPAWTTKQQPMVCFPSSLGVDPMNLAQAQLQQPYNKGMFNLFRDWPSLRDQFSGAH